MKRRNFTSRRHIEIDKNKIILIGFEGSTENNYFDNFKCQNKKYRIKYAFGNQTDPVNLVKNLYNTINREYDSDFFDSNKAYCVFDLDTYKNKEDKIKEALALCNKYGITPITSAPCIELWYLLHFEKCNGYINSDKVIQKLKKYIPNYEKGMNIFENMKEGVNDAINRAKELEDINKRNGYEIGSIDANPNTEVYKIIEYLLSIF